MSWAEVKKINSNLDVPLDKLAYVGQLIGKHVFSSTLSNRVIELQITGRGFIENMVAEASSGGNRSTTRHNCVRLYVDGNKIIDVSTNYLNESHSARFYVANIKNSTYKDGTFYVPSTQLVRTSGENVPGLGLIALPSPSSPSDSGEALINELPYVKVANTTYSSSSPILLMNGGLRFEESVKVEAYANVEDANSAYRKIFCLICFDG